MNKKLMKTVVVGLVVVLVMSLGAVAVFAQENAVPDTDTQPALPFGRGGLGGHHGHHGHGDADDDALAAALGITVEELQAAREQLMAERLAQAVEDGTLTQEQVDNMQAMQAVKEYVDREAILASALGITVEQLETAREDGTLYDLWANITPAELQARMQAATETAVNQAVADGAITQTQADLVLEQIANGVGGKFDPLGGHRDFGGRPGHGGFPGFDAQPDASGAAFAPSAAFGA